MSEPNTVTMNFRWATASPDPHNKTMRNTLEPVDIFVQVEVPMKHEYFVNSEPIIKAQLGVDGDYDSDKAEPLTPILSREGMQYVLAQLSLEVASEPEVSEEEWDEGNDEGEEWVNEDDKDDYNWDED